MTGASLAPGVEIPVVSRTTTAVDLFMFSAAAWLLHRIHYDLAYTTEEEGYPGLLIHGPLQGTYMVQGAQVFLGSGARLATLTYRHLAPAFLGEELECGGVVVAAAPESVGLELWVRKLDGTVTTQGKATFVLHKEGEQ